MNIGNHFEITHELNQIVNGLILYNQPRDGNSSYIREHCFVKYILCYLLFLLMHYKNNNTKNYILHSIYLTKQSFIQFKFRNDINIHYT